MIAGSAARSRPVIDRPLAINSLDVLFDVDDDEVFEEEYRDRIYTPTRALSNDDNISL